MLLPLRVHFHYEFRLSSTHFRIHPKEFQPFQPSFANTFVDAYDSLNLKIPEFLNHVWWGLGHLGKTLEYVPIPYLPDLDIYFSVLSIIPKERGSTSLFVKQPKCALVP